MVFDDTTESFTVQGAIIIAVISAICGIACVFATYTDKINSINDVFALYYISLSAINMIFCFILYYPTLKFVATVFSAFILPLLHLMGEKTTLTGVDVLCIPFIAANLFFLLCCIAQWHEETVDEVMKKLNGSDPYFANIKSEILKRCGDNTLEWGVENLSATKLFKLAHKGRILDEEEKKEKEKEEHMRVNYEKRSENRKIRFLNTVDI